MRRQFEGVPRKAAGGNAAAESASRIIGGQRLLNNEAKAMTPPFAGGIPMPAKRNTKSDILQGLAIGGLSGLGGPQGILGAAIAQIVPMLVDRMKNRSATQSKKGGGPVVKGKTKNEKMPQIPKGTPKKAPAKYKSGGKMKKGC